jgi:polyhydroxybutyrate depolymerase
MLDHLVAWLNIDTGRVYFTGLSNGGAMSHRIACELSDRVTAIAAVGGANQFSTAAPCDPQLPVAVMQIHGTEDPCWTYEA